MREDRNAKGELLKVLDTSIAIWFLRGHKKVAERASQEGQLLLPWTTCAEILIGAIKKNSPANTGAIENLIKQLPPAFPDAQTCRFYAGLQVTMEKKGTPIPVNDLWVAAYALQHGLTIVTCDPHFSLVPNLNLENWLA